jgi:hypothetical protein
MRLYQSALAVSLLFAGACSSDEGRTTDDGRVAVAAATEQPREAEEVADTEALLGEYGMLLAQAAVSGGDALDRTLQHTSASGSAYDTSCAPTWAHALLAAAGDAPADVAVDGDDLLVGDVEVPVDIEGDRALHLGGDCDEPLPQPDRPKPERRTPAAVASTAPPNAPATENAKPRGGAPAPDAAREAAATGTTTSRETKRPSRQRVTGDFVLTGQPYLTGSEFGGNHAVGDSCFGGRGFDDFGAGMNVTIRDAGGRIVASTSTGPARLVDYFPSLDALYCQTSFVTEMEVSDFYEVSVGRRGNLSLSHVELQADDFHVSLTLG